MLARPAAESNWAKLRSAGEASMGMPSSKSCAPVAPNNIPDSFVTGMAACNSFQAVWNCSIVRAWSKL
jgi:hypothetical protein